ncbi:MAG: antibiotic biosynthesis monooxygenase [Acidimicrobiia bacterium]|nr:antibiotic biosynthesis monooxygenase [Acidimicrobiia bacterium]
MIIIAGTIQIDPAKTDEAMDAAKICMQATHQEAGNEAYVFSLDPIEPGLVHVFEKWADDDSLASHLGTPHMAEFQGKMGGFGISSMSIKKYTGATEGELF